MRTALKRKSVVADGAGMVDVRSMAADGGVCIPVGVMPPDARPLRRVQGTASASLDNVTQPRKLSAADLKTMFAPAVQLTHKRTCSRGVRVRYERFPAEIVPF